MDEREAVVAQVPEGTPEKSAEMVLDVAECERQEVDGSSAGMGAFLTRGEVATILRVSIATVRRWQGKDLHPRRDDDGMYLFDPREVEGLRARRPPPPEPRECRDPGELAAEAFKLFRDGIDQRDVVIALKRPPHEIEHLYIAWERMGGALFVSEQVYGQLRRMVHCRLLAPEVLEAIEEDDYDGLREYVARAVQVQPRHSRVR